MWCAWSLPFTKQKEFFSFRQRKCLGTWKCYSRRFRKLMVLRAFFYGDCSCKHSGSRCRWYDFLEDLWSDTHYLVSRRHGSCQSGVPSSLLCIVLSTVFVILGCCDRPPAPHLCCDRPPAPHLCVVIDPLPHISVL